MGSPADDDCFRSLVAALIAERISVRAGLQLLPWLIAFGAGSVLQWYWNELHGHGDLRVYASVQAYSALGLLLALLLPPRYTRSRDFADRHIYSLGHIVSGHTLKHVAAAAAGYLIIRMLPLREPAAENSLPVNNPQLS